MRVLAHRGVLSLFGLCCQRRTELYDCLLKLVIFQCSLVCKVAELQEILPCEVWQFEFWPIEKFCPCLVCSVREGQNCSDCVFKLSFLRVPWFVRLRDSKTYCFATSSNSIFWPIEKSCAFSLCVVLESRNCDDCVLEWETAHFIEAGIPFGEIKV